MRTQFHRNFVPQKHIYLYMTHTVNIFFYAPNSNAQRRPAATCDASFTPRRHPSVKYKKKTIQQVNKRVVLY